MSVAAPATDTALTVRSASVDRVPASRPAPARRGLWAFAWAAAGLLAGLEWPSIPPALWLGLACAAAAAAIASRGWACRAAMGLGVALLAAGWIGVRVHAEPRASLSRLSNAESVVPVLVRGTVIDAPPVALAAPATPGFTRFDLRVRHADGPTGQVEAAGVCGVVIAGRVDVTPGARVQVRGFFIPTPAPSNPGERDQRPWARQEGRAGRISVESPDLVTPWSEPPGWAERAESSARRWVWSLRGFAARTLGRAVTPDDAVAAEQSPGRALLGALLLGETDPALRPIAGAMARLGQVHVLSISGFHLAVMAALALFLVRLPGDRGGGWLEPTAVGALVLLYMLIVPAESPILRSGLMVLALLAAEATGRRYDRLNLLGWIAVALLAWRPMDLCSAGFQLSFGITGVLVWLGTPFHRRLFPPRIAGRVAEIHVARDPGLRSVGATAWTWCTALVSTSLLCWAVATPTVMHHVGIVSPLGAATSVVMVPVFTLALWAGFVVLAAGSVWPGAAEAAGAILTRLGDASAWLALRLDGLPFMAVNVPPVPWWWTAAATAVILRWARGFEPNTRGARDRVMTGLASVVVAGYLVWLLAGAGVTPPALAVRVDALAVGDSSAALIRGGGTDQAALWVSSAQSPGALRSIAPRAARSLGCWRVRTIVVGGVGGGLPEDLMVLAEIAPALGARDVLVPRGLTAAANEQPAGPLAALLDALARAGVRVRGVGDGDAITLGAATIVLIAPVATDAPGSLVGLIRTRADAGESSRAILLAGRTRRGGLDEMLSRADAGGTPIVAAELPLWALPERTDAMLRSAGLEFAWRSESARLRRPPPRGPLGVIVRSTAADGAVWVQIDETGAISTR